MSADGAFSVIFAVLRCSWLAMSASFTPKLPRKMHPSSSQILMEILGLKNDPQSINSHLPGQATISSRSSRHFATRPTRDYSRFA
ncbi:MAG: hypothetical protein Q7U12_05155 [Undibacterium sp.]|nr:hypothetical protein [Undibacterium sp.]